MSLTSLDENELLHALALTMVPDIGPISAKKLISACGKPSLVFKERKGILMKIPGIGSKTVQILAGAKISKRAENELKFIQKKNIKIHYFLDPGYPTRLRQCADAPVILYAMGNPMLEGSRILAIVGTRRSTPYGETICQKLVAGLMGSGVMIISGLAFGIDACAHRAALDCGLDTVAVLGHGLDRIYPIAHRKLASQMLARGGLVTDFPSGTEPERNNFPSRNRIIAGLADAVLVVEAAEKGGALITADIATSYDRDVFAVPGRVDDAQSAGTNQLIHDNKAALVSSAQEILDWMSWDSAKLAGMQSALFTELSTEEQKVVEVIRGLRECSIDSLAIQTNLGVARTASLLFEMEIKGLVRSLPGKIYRLV